MPVSRVLPIALVVSVAAGMPLCAEELTLPPQVTPALRAACEADVRRLCLGQNPTVSKVKSCMTQRFAELSSRCKLQIAVAGLTPAGR